MTENQIKENHLAVDIIKENLELLTNDVTELLQSKSLSLRGISFYSSNLNAHISINELF